MPTSLRCAPAWTPATTSWPPIYPATAAPHRCRSARPWPRSPTRLEADLDTLGLGRVHVLGSSFGARLALELAIRGRAQSVVAIAPSGLGLPPERVYQGAALGTARVLMQTIRPIIDVAARFPAGRALLLANMRSTPWLSSEDEARAPTPGFRRLPGLLAATVVVGPGRHVPLNLQKIDCPVVLAQGTVDVMSSIRPTRATSRSSPGPASSR